MSKSADMFSFVRLIHGVKNIHEDLTGEYII
jgi:hypothetical protein